MQPKPATWTTCARSYAQNTSLPASNPRLSQARATAPNATRLCGGSSTASRPITLTNCCSARARTRRVQNVGGRPLYRAAPTKALKNPAASLKYGCANRITSAGEGVLFIRFLRSFQINLKQKSAKIKDFTASVESIWTFWRVSVKNTIPNNNLYYFLSPDYFFMDKKDTIPQYNIHPKSSKPLYSMFLFYSKGSLDTDLKKIYISSIC